MVFIEAFSLNLSLANCYVLSLCILSLIYLLLLFEQIVSKIKARDNQTWKYNIFWG
jgi:hypothetical protein